MIKNNIVELDDVVIKFAGDSGDGMQLTGTLFSDAAALAGNDLATFPDYPSEIRAPQNTISGVSGFTVHIGHEQIYSSGDMADVLIAMNPASLKSNLKWAKKGAILLVDANSFNEKALDKAGYKANPLEDGSLNDYKLIKVPITRLTKECLIDMQLDSKTISKSRNMFALGMMHFLFNQDLEATHKYFEEKFKKNPLIVRANKKVLNKGYHHAEILEAIESTFYVPPANIEKGKYRNINGNIATAWGVLAAAEKAGRNVFLGSYPITPASEILQEFSKHKSLNARVLQAEDEIAGICSAIGASFAGALAVTSTSGPGLSLKSEAIGLAVITELPIVIINVQRGGPSTGLPTKTEQSDLMQALFGRNGECPTIVLAASTVSNCFYFAYEASKLAMEHMTPVILLTDGYLGNGSEIFRIPKLADMPPINPPIVEPNDLNFKPYKRDEKRLRRSWAIPGTEGLRHRIGGLEKQNVTGDVSHDPLNHQLMTELRDEKVKRVVDYIPEQKVIGKDSGDLLVVSWGGTYGSTIGAVEEMQKQGKKVSLAHFNYINPLPKNTGTILGNFKKIIVCELNLGQFANYLRMIYPQYKYEQCNKIQGLPFMVSELVDKFNQILEEK